MLHRTLGAAGHRRPVHTEPPPLLLHWWGLHSSEAARPKPCRNQVKGCLPACPHIRLLAHTHVCCCAPGEAHAPHTWLRRRVSVFINARDGKDRNTLSYEGDVLAVAQYEQGINQAFPPAGGAPTAVPPGAMARWASMPPGLYALAIRLEALTDDGRAHGHSIDFVEAGGELPEWVQSQTTYVQLVRGDNGVWHASHVLQKLWINGSTFELQEIYGLEPSRGSASAAGGDAGLVDGVVEDDGGNECVICMSATRDTMSLPCRHMCMCHGCADELKTQTNKCPICRNVISSLLHIKIGKGQPGGASGAGAAAAAGPSA
eukprot:359072-Chlamydomonas_euryale.AAC.6